MDQEELEQYKENREALIEAAELFNVALRVGASGKLYIVRGRLDRVASFFEGYRSEIEEMMGGRIAHVPEPASTHSDRQLCPGMPPPEMFPRSTQWTCYDCDRIWVVVEEAQYNESYSAWRILTDWNRLGRDV